jgi:hypothetical protein
MPVANLYGSVVHVIVGGPSICTSRGKRTTARRAANKNWPLSEGLEIIRQMPPWIFSIVWSSDLATRFAVSVRANQAYVEETNRDSSLCAKPASNPPDDVLDCLERQLAAETANKVVQRVDADARVQGGWKCRTNRLRWAEAERFSASLLANLEWDLNLNHLDGFVSVALHL